MDRKRPRSAPSDTPALSLADLKQIGETWLLDGQIRRHSPRTLEARRDLVAKLTWFLERRGCDACGLAEVRGFLAYIAHGHEEPGGRWGNPRMTKPVKPRTSQTYFVNLQTLFSFAVDEGVIDASPFERLKPPIAREDRIVPFTADQVQALLEAAGRSSRQRRDVALMLLMLDTGARVSELCDLTFGNLDLGGRKIVVTGKGDKVRSIPFGARAASALWRYLRGRPRGAGDPVFVSEGGRSPGQRMTRRGMLSIVSDLGKAAGLSAVRCSPHTFRHTFSVQFLRDGGAELTLMEMLGHTSLRMTQRYVTLARADLEAQHRLHSPADRMNLDARRWGKERRRR